MILVDEKWKISYNLAILKYACKLNPEFKKNNSFIGR